jgi:3',5'-cyclic-AMP phosphodiesterase
MPGLYFQPIHRRQFLKASVLAGAAMVLHGSRSLARAASEDEIHLALLSDTHVGPGERAKDPRGFDPCAQLKRVVPAIIAGSPRGVILNGDAASREGLVEDYQELKTLVDPLGRVAPVYIGFGNHDHPGNFKEVFNSTPGLSAAVPNRQVLIIEESFIRFIVLDSLLYVNKVAGLLGAQQRTWLTDYLKTHEDKPIVLFVHHTLGDGDGDMLDANRLFEIIRPHRQVKAIFYGHSHMWEIGEKNGVKLINLPSIAYPFSKEQPVGWVDARFQRNGVDLTLHTVAGNEAQNGKTSRVSWT